MSLSRTPVYNLGVVLREVGIPADTLRAWERRYGLPAPRRTQGGHRLYSDWDIGLIKWLRSRQAEGMTISRAVARWKDLVTSGQDPLADSADGLAPAAPRLLDYSPLEALRAQWLAAALRFDEPAAERALDQAFAQFPLDLVTASVIESALHEVGEMWARGEATVQQEHFLSALSVRRLEALIAASPSSAQEPVALLACVQGEPHSLPLLHLSLLLRRRGQKVVFLGANVPIEQVAKTADAVHAALAVLSAEQLVTAATLREQAVALTRAGIPVAYGGRIFIEEPDLCKHMPGTYLGDTIGTAAQRAQQLLHEPPPRAPRAQAASSRGATAFLQARPRIENALRQYFAKRALPSRLLVLANDHFGPGLAAALDLGNVRYLESDVRWIYAVLASHGLPVTALRDYLLAYADAVRRVMGASAADLTAWMRGQAARTGSQSG